MVRIWMEVVALAYFAWWMIRTAVVTFVDASIAYQNRDLGRRRSRRWIYLLLAALVLGTLAVMAIYESCSLFPHL